MDKLLKQPLEVLNFKGMLNALDGLSESTQWTPSQWVEPLKILLEAEIAYRTSRSFLYRMERAKLPQIKTLKDFDLCDSPLCSEQIKQLGTCDFIPAHQNILLLGGLRQWENTLGAVLCLYCHTEGLSDTILSAQ